MKSTASHPLTLCWSDHYFIYSDNTACSGETFHNTIYLVERHLWTVISLKTTQAFIIPYSHRTMRWD